jgi:integrase
VFKGQYPFLQSEESRHGAVCYYVKHPDWRRDSGRMIQMRIKAMLGTPEFKEQYDSLILYGPTGKPERRTDFKDSFKWLCGEYLSSLARLKKTTRAVRTRELDRLCRTEIYLENGDATKVGDFPYSAINRTMVVDLRDDAAHKVDKDGEDIFTPSAAQTRLKFIKCVLNFAVEKGYLKHSPAQSVKKISFKSTGYHTWTLEEIEQFEECHRVGTKARLAMALLRYTLQRRSDIVRLGLQTKKSNSLVFKQEKTGQQMSFPILPELTRIIEASPVGAMVWLEAENQRKPYTPQNFGRQFRIWCDEAGLPHCSAHGVRKGGCVILAEQGMSAHEIMSITGHKTLQEVQRYTEDARREVLAASAIRGLAV